MLYLGQVHGHLLGYRTVRQPGSIEPLGVLGALDKPVVWRAVEPEVEGRSLRGVGIVLFVHRITAIIHREGVRQRSGTVTQRNGTFLLPVLGIVELGHRVKCQRVQAVEVADIARRSQLVAQQREVGCRRHAECQFLLGNGSLRTSHAVIERASGTDADVAVSDSLVHPDAQLTPAKREVTQRLASYRRNDAVAYHLPRDGVAARPRYLALRRRAVGVFHQHMQP